MIARTVSLFLALVSLIGCAFYYTSKLTTPILVITLLLALLVTLLITLKKPGLKVTPLKLRLTTLEGIIGASGLFCLILWWLQIFPLREAFLNQAHRTLWDVVNPEYLFLIALAWWCVLLLAYRASWLAWPLASLTLFSGVALAASLFPLGFGFDPFIHRATIEHLANFGTITPKPLYYIGQYVLELIAVKLFFIPLNVVDSLLVPVLFSVLVPLFLIGQRQPIVLATLVLIPLGIFVQTTPMALALLWTLLTVLAPREPKYLPAILSLAALLTHPLTGIPAVIYVVLLTGDEFITHRYLRQAFRAVIFTVSSLAIPLAFVIQAKISGLALNFDFGHLFAWTELPLTSFIGTHWQVFGDLAYTFIKNSQIFLVILAILTLVMVPASRRLATPNILIAASLLVSFIVLSLGFDFRFLISYERTDFALRLLGITLLFLIPILRDGVVALFDRVKPFPALTLGIVGLSTMMFAAFTYGAYPRHDNYARSAGFNVTTLDLATVHAIDNYQTGEEYAVLADQALSAAAIREFGFVKYYPGDIFYYPVPTGGPLYAIYLDLVENGPELQKIEQAMELTGVDLVFFAIHGYWWQADRLIENTKPLARDWFAFGQGEQGITIFVFSR